MRLPPWSLCLSRFGMQPIGVAEVEAVSAPLLDSDRRKPCGYRYEGGRRNVQTLILLTGSTAWRITRKPRCS